MRKIDKDFNAPPARLKRCAREYMVDLLENRERHNFKRRCYNKAVNRDLRRLHHDKCAYCESRITAVSYITIDHYRPKKGGYYWLAYEWSNLLPACPNCNSFKGNQFPTAGKRLAAPPADETGSLVYEKCRADCPDFLAETPLLIHPEIDNPKVYFTFDGNGVIRAKSNSEKAAQTIKIIQLDRSELNLNRKKIIDDFTFAIEEQTNCFFEWLDENDFDEKRLPGFYFTIFKRLIAAQYETEEYTLLIQLFERFDEFFSIPLGEKYSNEYKALIQYAFNLFCDKYTR